MSLRIAAQSLSSRKKWLGPAEAQALVDLIADGEALEKRAELIDFYQAEVLQGDCLSVAFSPNRRALLQAAGRRLPRVDGNCAWEQVRRLMLVDIQEP